MKKNLYYLMAWVFIAINFISCDKNDMSNAPSNNGIGGSMARFTIAGNVLYTVDHQDLKVFDISTPANPEYIQDFNLGWGIETIFPYNQHLFIGSQTGMHIYNIVDPLNPKFVSVYQHVTACDPVVVQGNHAYVTLRNGTECRFASNVLDVLDISNFEKPQLISTRMMYNPHGLAVSGDHLFVCEGNYGLQIFNVVNPSNPEFISHNEGFHAYDVIALPHVLIITGNAGIYQYNYDDILNLKLLSIMPVVREVQ